MKWAIFVLLISAYVSSGRYHNSYNNEDKMDTLMRSLIEAGMADGGMEERDANEMGIENIVEDIVDANNVAREEASTSIHKIQMPKVAPSKMDTYLCAAYKLPKDSRYIVKYEPLAEMQVAHHMLLYGCEVPYKKTGSWNCREMKPVCGDGKQSIVYAWAKNAPSLVMPKDVGFHVGGGSHFHYLVLQVHYLDVSKFKDDVTDNSGVNFTLDKRKKRYLAGIYLLADGWAPIPPHKPKSYINMGCSYPEGPVFTPFRFRVHAHKLGVVITGYRVRDNKWTLIGRGDPQRPQAFYKTSTDMDVKPGDTLIGRCTYNSTGRDTTTYIGATHTDEMCNFYIMYYYDSKIYGDGADKTPCINPSKGFFYNYPKDSDVPLAVMEKLNHVVNSGSPLVP